MKIDLYQIDSTLGTYEERIRRVAETISKLESPEFICLPELWAVGFMSFEQFHQRAETIDGPLVSQFKSLAKEKSCYLAMGSFVEKRGSKFYNSSLVFNPNGEVIANYRKIHLFTYKSQEAELLAPGNELVTFSTDWGKIGLTTCYDLRFPELYRALLDEKVEVFLTPAAWPLKRLSHYQLFTEARAIENLAFMVSPNCCGGNDNKQLAGHSRIVAPFGDIQVEAGLSEELITTNISLEEIQYWRTHFSSLRDRQLPLPKKVP